MQVTEQALEYLRPLIVGEAYPTYHNGLPLYRQFEGVQLSKKIDDSVLS